MIFNGDYSSVLVSLVNSSWNLSIVEPFTPCSYSRALYLTEIFYGATVLVLFTLLVEATEVFIYDFVVGGDLPLENKPQRQAHCSYSSMKHAWIAAKGPYLKNINVEHTLGKGWY